MTWGRSMFPLCWLRISLMARMRLLFRRMGAACTALLGSMGIVDCPRCPSMPQAVFTSLPDLLSFFAGVCVARSAQGHPKAE